MIRQAVKNGRATVVGRNATALLAARVITVLGNLGLAALVATRLGSAGFGTFAALLAGGAVANLAITFGVDLVVVRAVAANRPDAATTVRQALLLQVLGASLLLVLALVAVGVGASPLILVPAVTLYPMGVTTVASSVLRGAEDMTPIPAGALAASLTALGVAVLFVSDGVWVAVLAVAVGQLVNAAVLVSRAAPTARALPPPVDEHRQPLQGQRQRQGKGRGQRQRQRQGLGLLVSESWVFALATLATAVMVQGGLIVYETIGQGDAGGLAAGVRLSETARMVPAAAFGALFPSMFDGVHRSPRYRRLFLALLGYGTAVAAGLALLAPVLNDLVFDDPPDGVAAIRILAIGLVATVFRLRYSFELIAVGREQTVLVIAAVSAVGAVAGYLLGAALDSVVIVATVQVTAAVLAAAALAGANRRAVS